MSAKHYGLVFNVAEGEPGAATGTLSVAAVLADSVHSPHSVVALGSPVSSAIDLAQLCLTAEQAVQLGALLSAAGADALEADSRHLDVAEAKESDRD